MRLLLWVLQLTTLAMVIGGCGRVQGRAGVKELTAYYVQFGVETLTPVTSANIQERGTRCEILSSKDVGKLEKRCMMPSNLHLRNFRMRGFA